MKAIGLNANLNTDTGRKALTDALNSVQEGCRARTLDLEDIGSILKSVEYELSI